MFAKPYKLRATNTLKNSEKKSLVQRIRDEFPFISEESAKELVPIKSSAVWLRLELLNSNKAVSVLAVDNVPTLLQVGNTLAPTVWALWKAPNMLPMITIHESIVPKVANGAPLYVPGVMTSQLPNFPCGALIAARTEANAAAALVARASLSSGDLFLRSNGPCVDILHVYGDQLCRDKRFPKCERPLLLSNTDLSRVTHEVDKLSLRGCDPTVSEWPALPGARPATAPAQICPTLIPDSDQASTDSSSNENSADTKENKPPEDPSPGEDEGVPDSMDERLRWALLAFMRLHGKRATLPLKTNILYKNHLMSLCPPEKPLDVKKSSYKKVSKFLEAMQKEGLVELKEEEKGVWAVTQLKLSHAAVTSLRLPASVSQRAAAAAAARQPQPQQTDYAPPVIRELYCITAAVAPLFTGHKKGSGLTGAEVRAAVVEHVRSRQLASAVHKGAVTLDTVLADILGLPEKEVVGWDAVVEGVRAHMTAAAELTFPGRPPALVKRSLPPIAMAIATRAGNKKVTLVSNLETYGFDLAWLARAWQGLAGAACVVTRVSGAARDQLMLQGDQTYFVANMLVNKYGLPKKYVEGADKALSKKKG